MKSFFHFGVCVLLALSLQSFACIPQPPTADITYNPSVPLKVGETAYFLGSGVCPQGGSIVAGEWVFPPQAYNINRDTTDSPNCKFFPARPAGQPYQVKLRVLSTTGLWSSYATKLVSVSASEGPWYVSIDGNDNNNGKFSEDLSDADGPFRTIQIAIDSAGDDDEIIVMSGTAGSPAIYYEQLDLKGKSLTIRSDDPDNWEAVENTIIDAGRVGTAIVYRGTETGTLKGFTITSGAPAGDGLALHLTMDDEHAPGFDSSGKDRHGILNGTEWTADGYQGGALSFDGIDDHIEIPNYPGVVGRNPRTISTWVKMAENSASPMTIASWGGSADGQKWKVQIDSSLKVDVGGGLILGQQNITEGQWHHIAVVLEDDASPDVNKIKLYINGVEPSTMVFDCIGRSRPIDTSASDAVIIGACADGSVHSNKYHGLLDDFRIYSRALSESEIQQQIWGGSSIDDSVAHWKLDEESGTQADDSSGNSYHGTLTNFPASPSPWTNGRIGGGLKFDGSSYITTSWPGITGGASRSCSAWIKTTATSGAQIVLAWGTQSADDQARYWLFGLANGKIVVGDINSYMFGTTLIADGQWHHITAVLDSFANPKTSDITLYVNGVQEAISYNYHAERTINTGGDNVILGARFVNGNYNYYQGSLDDVRIYDRALSAFEVRELAESRKLVAHWKLDGDVNDCVGSRHGTNYGAMLDAGGISGKAAEFYGNEHIEVEGYSGITGTQARTISAWIKKPSSSAGEMICAWGKIDTSDPGKGYGLFMAGNYMAISLAGPYIRGTTDLGDERWHHVVAVLKDTDSPVLGNVRFFIDGKPEPLASSSHTSVPINTFEGDVIIGAAKCVPNQIAYNFTGLIDDVRIYNYELSKAEIQALYDTRFADGGGIRGHGASPAIEQCIITNNISSSNGGGVAGVNGMITHCFIGNNESAADGGGLSNCNGGLVNIVVAKNIALNAGAINSCSGTVVNCTIADNSAYLVGGGIRDCDGAVINSILWNNRDNSGCSQDAQIRDCAASISFSCIQNWNGGGSGNISGSPAFINSKAGNYRLDAGSSCIDVGDPNLCYVNQLDLDGAERVSDYGPNPRVDLGAYEFTKTIWYVKTDGSDLNDGRSWSTAFATIQKGIDQSNCGAIVLVSEGVYTGTGNRDIDFGGKAITVRSVNGPESCIIDCQNTGRGFYFHNQEGPESVLSGFSIINGFANDNKGYGSGSGGGILCGDDKTTPKSAASPTIMNCIVRGNAAKTYGGGLFAVQGSNPVLINCLFIKNSAERGGAVYSKFNNSHLNFVNCTFVSNTATVSGGAFHNHSPESITAYNCILYDNSVPQISATHGSILISYSLIQGGYAGEGNIEDDPSFVDSDNGNYRLSNTSPCIDAGNDDEIPEGVTADLDGQLRNDGTVDMGAYEFQINHAPVANDDPGVYGRPIVCFDGSVTINVLANDYDPDGDDLWIDSDFEDPENGSVMLSNGGLTVTYSPTDNFSGIDTFRYRATDGHSLSNWATVTIQVQQTLPEHDPVANPDTAVVALGTSVVIDVLDNDFHPGQDTITVKDIVSGPSRGTAVITQDGKIRYTPSSADGEPDTFIYRIEDSAQRTAQAEVTVRILAVEAGPNQTITLPSDRVILLGKVMGAGEDVTVLWSAAGQPAGSAVAFDSPAAAETMAVFSLPGTYYLHIEANSDGLTVADMAIIEVKPNPGSGSGNQAPLVLAWAEPDEISLPVNTTVLRWTISDDGISKGGLTQEWEVVDGPLTGQVWFGTYTPQSRQTTATFSTDGPYILKLKVSDGFETAEAFVLVKVNPDMIFSDNMPPDVNAGNGQTILLTPWRIYSVLYSDAEATDDGKPNSSLTYQWSIVESRYYDENGVVQIGAGAVVIDRVNELYPILTFMRPGTYTLRLEAHDGQYTVGDDVVFELRTEYLPQDVIQIDAGPDQTITLPAPAFLIGASITDADGDPISLEGLTLNWNKVSGPGDVEFYHDGYPGNHVLHPEAKFSKAGDYWLELAVSDGSLIVSDRIFIKVYPGTRLATAAHSSFFINAYGQVWAAGSNCYGQLGNGTAGFDLHEKHDHIGAGSWFDHYSYSSVLAGEQGSDVLRDICSLGGGWSSSYALDYDGNVWGWGNNTFGQLGIGRENLNLWQPVTEPRRVRRGLQPSQGEYLEDIVAISTSTLGLHTLALDKHGSVWSWGYNYQGTIGNGYYDPDLYNPKNNETPGPKMPHDKFIHIYKSVIEPLPVPVGSPSTVLELYLKFDNPDDHYPIVDYSGNNREIKHMPGGDSPSMAAGVSDYQYTFIDPGYKWDINHCSRFWGQEGLVVEPNYFGILGDNPRTISFWIKKSDHCIGTILSWGCPATVGGLWEIRVESNRIALYADNMHYLKTNEVIDPNAWNHVVVVLPDGAAHLSQVEIYLAREGDLDCLPADVVLSADCEIYTLPGNSCRIGRSQIEDPNFNPNKYYIGLLDELQVYSIALSQQDINHIQRYPYFTAPMKNITSVSSGSWHSVSLEKLDDNSNSQGRVYSWGLDMFWWSDQTGSLGLGDDNEGRKVLPQCVNTGEQGHPSGYLSNIVAISAGIHHNMALEKYTEDSNDLYSGRILTWGWDSIGFRRTFNANDHYQFPVDNEIGYYDVGRLGRGNTVYGVGEISTVPVYVYGPDVNGNGQHDPEEGYLENIIAIAAGESHSMALDKDGYVWVWGDNTHGQLGIGDISVRSSGFPVKVKAPLEYDDPDSEFLGDPEKGKIIAIEAGPWHCLALDEYGDVWVWGASWAIGCGAPNHHGVFLPKKIVFGNRVKRISGEEEQWYADIQPAIDDANEGDEIVVYPGVYRGFRLKGHTWNDPNTNDPNLYIHSWNPHEPNLLTKPVIMPIEISDGKKSYNTGIFVKANHSRIEGFTISEGQYGIVLQDSDSIISHNVITNNSTAGIYCIGQNGATILNNIIDNNGRYNIYSKGGVYCRNGSNIKIIGNLIKRNYNGLNFEYHIPEGDPDILACLVWNNTIVKNNKRGVVLSGNNYLTYSQQPLFRNCIIWGNGSNPDDNLYGQFDRFDYCALEEGQDLPTSLVHMAIINSSGDAFADINEAHYFPLSPAFLNADPDDPNNCINRGCPFPESNSINYWVNYIHMDVESKIRISGSAVDLGANEYLSYRIDAGQDKTARVGEAVSMDDAQVIKDGSPCTDISPYSVHWYIVQKPQNSAFIVPAQAAGQINPSWTLDALGDYIFSFELYDELGNWVESDTVKITVSIFIEVDPAGDFELGYDPSTGQIGTTVNLCGRVRGVNPAVTPIVWTVPDNVPIVLGAASLVEEAGTYQSTVPITFYMPGRYHVRLDVFDMHGYSIAEDSIFIDVYDLPYQADAGRNITRSWQGEDIVIPLSGRLLPCSVDGESYEWRYIQGPADSLQFETSDGQSSVSSDLRNPAATFRGPGIYYLQFAVMHPNIGCMVDDLTVIIDTKEIPLTVFAGTRLYGRIDSDTGVAAVQSRNAFVYPTDDVSVQWYDQNNNPVIGATSVDAPLAFTDSDTYEYTLTAIRGEEAVSSTVKITIYPSSTGELIIQAGQYGPVLAGTTLPLVDAFVSIGGVTYRWSSDDEDNVTFSHSGDEGRTSNALHPHVHFAEHVEKIYTLTLTVSSNGSEIGSAGVSIQAVTQLTPPTDTEPPRIIVTPALLDEYGYEVPWPEPGAAIEKGYVSLHIYALDDLSGIASITVQDICGGSIVTVPPAHSFSQYPRQVWLPYELNVLDLAAGEHTIEITAVDKSGNSQTDNSVQFKVARPIPNQSPNPYAVISNLQPQAINYEPLGIQDQLPEITEGLYSIKGIACDPNGTQQIQFRFELYDPAAMAYPQLNTWHLLNGKHSPNPDYFVQQLTVYGADAADVYGYYNGPVGGVHPEVDYGTFGRLDLTGVNNGTYALRLTVRSRPDENTAFKYAYAVKQFILNCTLKIGNVKFSQEDVVIPVGGIPLRIIRTYDSFAKDRAGDFGYGWSYSIANMDIQLHEERSDMAEFMDDVSGYGYVTKSVRTGSNFDRNVSLTLPDGNRVTFQFYLDYIGGYAPYYIARYQSPYGVTARLETLKEERLNTMNLWEGQNSTTHMSGTGEYNNPAHYEFSGYRLITDDGTTFTLSRLNKTGAQFGEQAIYIEPKGSLYLSHIDTTTGERIILNVDENTLHIGQTNNHAGVEHEINGVVTKAVEIDYDAQGRIEKIWAPTEQGGSVPTVRYEYDAFGNLQYVRKLIDKAAADPNLVADPNLAYETLTFLYEDPDRGLTPSDHYITAIQDPRGLQPIRYEYDDSGRLIATVDAKGNRIQIQHNVVDKIETVFDRSGNKTDYYYNDRGNVVQIVNYKKIGEDLYESVSETGYKYGDDPNNLDRPIEIKQSVPDPDALDYPDTLIDSVTRMAYTVYGNDRLQTETTIDPVGNLTKTFYDEAGNVTMAIAGKDAQNFDAYTELTTSRHFYTDRNLPYLSGVTTTDPEEGLVWHSLSLTYYDSQNRVTCTAQINTDVWSFGDLFDDEVLIGIDQIDPAVHPTTRYVYDPNFSNSPDQPYSITDPSGQTQYFRYDANNRQIEGWYRWQDPAGIEPDKFVFSVPTMDDQDRITESRQIIAADADRTVEFSNILQGRTVYNAIGKVDYTIDQYGVVTKYEYDQTGHLVETLVYENFDAYCDNYDSYPDNTTGLLTISRTLYDVEGRTIVAVGPYAPGDEPVGTETLYGAMGRVVETRRWANVHIELADLKKPGQATVVGRKVPDGKLAANAWMDTPAGLLAWTAGGTQPIASLENAALLSYTQTKYDSAGRVWRTYSQDDAGVEVCTAEYVYDIAGRQILTISQPGTEEEAITETEYDGTRRSAVIDAQQNRTEFICDAFGRVTTTIYPPTDVDGIDLPQDGDLEDDVTYTHVGYDGLGRKAWESAQTMQANPDFDDSTTSDINLQLRKKFYGYDPAGRLVWVQLPAVDDPEDASTDLVNPVYEYFYDGYGNMVGICDPKGRLTVFKYDAHGRQTHRYMPFALVAAIDRNADFYSQINLTGRPCAETTYDPFGRVAQEKDYKGQYALYAYYDQTNFRVEGVLYGLPGQLMQIAYYDGDPEGSGQLRSSLSVVYDAYGRKTTETMWDDDGTAEGVTRSWHYNYDAEGNIEKIETPQGTINYGYNSTTGHKTLVCKDMTDLAVRYGYDALGRLDEVQSMMRGGVDVSSEGTTQYRYNAVGSRRSLKYANGNYAEYGYDAMNRLRALVNYQTEQKTHTLSSFDYALYANGMRAGVTEMVQVGSPLTPETRTVEYVYDNLNRLIEETAYSGTNGYAVDYTYDLVGNRLRRVVAVGGQVLTTVYDYDNDTDRLKWETHAGPASCVYIGQKRYYAYQTPGGGLYYLDDTGTRISPLNAYFRGLPLRVNQWLFRVLMALIPIALFAPAFIRAQNLTSRKRFFGVVWHRGTCLLLAYVMLFTPEMLHQLARADTAYSDLCTTGWGVGDTAIHYRYDANGSMTEKLTAHINETDPDANYTEKVVYVYNLQGRLSRAETYDDTHSPVSATEYRYNTAGIRVQKTEDADSASPLVTDYLIDPHNPTGYAQVLQETTGANVRRYTIGHDVLSQALNANSPQYLLLDGHGSTRQLVNSDLTIAGSYSYDGYGIMLSDNSDAAANAATSLLYTGQQYDSSLQQYYLRARYYNPNNGVFNRADPFSGNLHDPQSLHKYAYCHNNPVNGVDPTGNIAILPVAIGLFTISLIGYYLIVYKPRIKKMLIPRTVNVTISISTDKKPRNWDSTRIQEELITSMKQLNINPRYTLNIMLVEETNASSNLGWQKNGDGLREKYFGRVHFEDGNVVALSNKAGNTTIHENCIQKLASTKSGPILWDITYSNILAHEMFWLNMGDISMIDSSLPSYAGEISSKIGSFNERVTISEGSRKKILNVLDFRD